ncbi:DUF2188 domain-containing protein [Microbacterium sp. NPDC096154]|uniref:DUF2188 domain-containing protein n=1 Tax=Microbacterium sp. NPDC096154 TaxID=3155549 RepID=UPI0033178626
MPHGDVETFHEDGSWHNRVEGESGTLGGSFRTKDQAARAGRELARERGVEHILRDLDGRIGERSTYGHDPRDVKG